jgi:hypothetical protein
MLIRPGAAPAILTQQRPLATDSGGYPMPRTTQSDLNHLVEALNLATDRDYEIQYAYGSPRLVRKGGSVDVSPRLPAGQLRLFMEGMLTGIWAMQTKQVAT